MIHISVISGGPMRTRRIVGAALFACAVAVTAGVPKPALGEVVAEYTFDDGTAHDTSDHGHDGTIVGDPATVAGFAGDALSFDGLDDYVVVSDTLDLRLDTFAVTVWLRAEKIPTRDATVLEKWQDGQGYRLVIDGATGALEFDIGGGSGAQYAVQAPFPVFGDVWTTATATYDGTELALYIDGSLVAQTAASGLDIKNEADLFIAADAEQSRLFNGDIDEVVIDNATALASDVCATAQKLWHAPSDTCIERFTDVTDELGLGAEDKSHFGMCLVDVDQDGWVDVYYANGRGAPKQPEEPEDGVCQDLDGIPPHPLESENTFYLNLGDGTFGPDIAPELGIADIWTAMQNVWGDYDNDGLRDLMSHNFLRSPLYHAVSADPMLFEDVSEEAGVELCLLRGTGASWVDLNNDGWLDLYAVQYGGAPAEKLLNPMYINNGDPDGDGNVTFTEITVEAGVDDPNNPMGTTFADYDNDGDQDVFVPNTPPTPTRLYRNDGINLGTGLPHFTDVAVEAGVAISGFGNKGVSTGWGDYNNDGRLDLLFGRENDSHLWRNDGPNADGVWTFTDITGQGGLDLAGYRFWGGNFADLDNDGWLDIVMTNQDVPGPNRIYLNNRDGTWREVSELLEMDLPDENQQGFVAGDLDNDGDLEVVLLGFTAGHPNSVFRNNSRGNNWIQFRLTGTVSNRDAVGARITLTAAAQPDQPAFEQIREVTAGTGFFSDFPRIQTFGLGKARVADEVRINWPSGQQLTLVNVPINQRLDLVEGDPPPDPIVTSLSPEGPTLLIDNSTYSFTATAEYYYALPGDVTAQSVWSVEPSDYAEFTAPGELTVSAVPANQTVQITASLSGFEASMSLLIQPEDLVDTSPPTLTVAQGGSITTEEATVVLNGTAEDDLGVVVSVMWSIDHGAGGPCTGLSEWSTGAIPLLDGANVITVRATDNADNESSTSIMVERVQVEPEPDDPPEDPDPIDEEPSDPEEPNAPDDEEPVGTDEPPSTGDEDESGDADTTDEPIDIPDATDGVEPTPDSPVPDGEMDGDSSTDGGRSNPTGICGGIGAINLAVTLLGICALRRRRVEAECQEDAAG